MTIEELCLWSIDHPPAVKDTWVDLFDEMIVHTRKAKPEKLICKMRPNEPKELYDYRIKDFEHITTGSINDAINRGQKILQTSNFEYKNGISERLKEKLKNPLFEFDALGSPDESKFDEVMFNRAFRIMIESGNALFVPMPINSVDNYAAPIEMQESQEVDPGYTVVEPKNIFYLSNDECIFRLKNKVVVKKDKQDKLEYEYMYVSKEKYIKLEPYYTREQNKTVLRFTENLWYSFVLEDSNEDALEVLPVIMMKGFPMYDKDGNLYYDSFFSGFMPWANEAIKAFSDNSVVRRLNNFPRTEEKEEDCDTCRGSGKIKAKGKDEKIACKACKGTGRATAKGPFSVYKKRKPATGEDADWQKIDAVKFYAPPADSIRLSTETWENFLDRADRAVNIKYLIDQAQSGTSKDHDREGLVDMLMAISKNWFDNVMYKSLLAYEGIVTRLASNRQPPVIKAPNADDLQIKTSSHLLNELKELQSAPVFLRNMKIEEITSKIYPDNPDKIKFLKVLEYYDPFFGYSEEEIKNLPPTIFREDRMRHELAENELYKFKTREKQRFDDMDIPEIAKMLEDVISPRFKNLMNIQSPFNNVTE